METVHRTSSDTDSDNDGIPDSASKRDSTGGPDTDGDGTPDFQDTDSDNDGIPDSTWRVRLYGWS